VVKKYFDKDIVERSFRTMKGEVQLHPIRLWLPNRVNAHVKICYLSMCILSLMQCRCASLGISAVHILNELKTIYKVEMKHSATKATLTKVVSQSNHQKNILKKLKCSV
jgi:transposase